MVAQNPARKRLPPFLPGKTWPKPREICSFRFFTGRPRFSPDDHLHVSFERALTRQHLEPHTVAYDFKIRALHGRTDIRREHLGFDVEHGLIHGDVQVRRFGFRSERREFYALELDVLSVEAASYTCLQLAAQATL